MNLNFKEHKPVFPPRKHGQNGYCGFRVDKHNKLLISKNLSQIMIDWDKVKVYYDSGNKKILFKKDTSGHKITRLANNAVMTCNGLKDYVTQARYFYEGKFDEGLLFGLDKPIYPSPVEKILTEEEMKNL